MNTLLLIFFAIPLAVIVFSIVLQKLICNPFLVSAVILSISLIIVIAFFEPIYLIAVFAYTVLAFITAFLTKLICRLFSNCNNLNCICCNNDEQENIISMPNNTENFYNDNEMLCRRGNRGRFKKI